MQSDCEKMPKIPCNFLIERPPWIAQFRSLTNLEHPYVEGVESGMVQWLRVEACDREIRVQFPAPAVISDLVVVCHSS